MAGDILSAPRLGLSQAAVEELSRRRQEPEWLLAVRLRAFEAFERMPLPDQRTEGWRRTSLRGLPLDGLDPLPGDDLGPAAATIDDSLAQQAAASLFAYRNGAAQREAGLPAGVAVLTLAAALDDPKLAARVQRHFGSIVPIDSDKFTALHYAWFNAGVVVFVPRGVAVPDPIWIRHTFDQSQPAALVHTLIVAEDEADVRVVEEYRGAPALVSSVVEHSLGGNAHLRYVHLQCFSEDVWNFSTQRSQLGQDASLRTLNVVVGARTTRNTVQVALAGRGGQADVLGVAASDGRQHVDFETLQDHVGDATRSDLIIHTALRDRSTANFTGLIRINKPAHQTESSQEQKNILLSDHARADSDPKLEILNNDVIRCTHGAAVGPVDPEMLFYLESRGLDRATAEQLIVEGFFRSTMRKIELPAVEEAVWTAITAHETSRQQARAEVTDR